MKDVWRSVSMRLGVPFVMAPGQPMMPMLPVDNWDMLPQVYFQAKSEMQNLKCSHPSIVFPHRSEGLH